MRSRGSGSEASAGWRRCSAYKFSSGRAPRHGRCCIHEERHFRPRLPRLDQRSHLAGPPIAVAFGPVAAVRRRRARWLLRHGSSSPARCGAEARKSSEAAARMKAITRPRAGDGARAAVIPTRACTRGESLRRLRPGTHLGGGDERRHDLRHAGERLRGPDVRRRPTMRSQERPKRTPAIA
jgi:hypothetical protein